MLGRELRAVTVSCRGCGLGMEGAACQVRMQVLIHRRLEFLRAWQGHGFIHGAGEGARQ